jgi:hypothetical protein
VTDDQIIEMANQHGIMGPNEWMLPKAPVLAFARLIQQAQREEDARIVEKLDADKFYTADRAGIIGAAHLACAAAIRNSGGAA